MSDWVGTDDGSPGNMTQTAAYIYDGSQGAVSQTTGVGDGNLTQVIEYPGGGAGRGPFHSAVVACIPGPSAPRFSVARNLRQTASHSLNVPKPEQGELFAIVESRKGDIVRTGGLILFGSLPRDTRCNKPPCE